MKWKRKQIAFLGIGLVFLFAMLVTPLGDLAAGIVYIEPDAGPGNGLIEIDAGYLETDFNHAILPRFGTPMIDIGYYIDIA